MGLFSGWRRGRGGRGDAIRIRCGMCRVVTEYPPDQRGAFVKHTCDSHVLVGAGDAAALREALDLFVRTFGPEPIADAERSAARDRLLHGLGEGAIPGLEDLLYRLKYATSEPFPPPELATRARQGAPFAGARIDWSNFLEMALHRMKEIALTRRALDAAPDTVKPILRDKLDRLRTEDLEPIED